MAKPLREDHDLKFIFLNFGNNLFLVIIFVCLSECSVPSYTKMTKLSQINIQVWYMRNLSAHLISRN